MITEEEKRCLRMSDFYAKSDDEKEFMRFELLQSINDNLANLVDVLHEIDLTLDCLSSKF